MKKVYLAGNVFEVNYRESVKKQYGNQLILLDPMEENGAIVDVSKSTVIHNRTNEQIVETDKDLIDKSDILVAVINRLSIGTIMEIIYAYSKKIPTYAIVPEYENFHNDIWLKYHTTKFFFNVIKCYDYILK